MVVAQKVASFLTLFRSIVFSILAALFGLQSLAVGLLILAPSPWLGVRTTGGPTVEISRWHFAQGGAVAGILTGMLLLAALWRPERKPVLLQMTAVGLLNGLVNTMIQMRSMGLMLRFFPSLVGTTQNLQRSRHPRWVNPMELSKPG